MTECIPSDVAVRSATDADADALASIVRFMGSGPSPVNSEYVRESFSRPGFGVLVAEGRNGIVGLLSYSIRPNLWHAADACLIEILAVRPDARGAGVGSALMKAIIARAALCGCAEITVMADAANEGAIRLYRRHGLEEQIVGLERHF